MRASSVGLLHDVWLGPIMGQVVQLDEWLCMNIAHVMLYRRTWLRQSRLLALLCCSLLGSAAAPEQDVLLELAAARVLTLLLNPSSWACCASGAVSSLDSCFPMVC